MELGSYDTYAMPALRRLPATRGKRMTSVELPPELLKAARLHAATLGITLRELIEEALRHRLAQKEDAMTIQRTRLRREGTP
jgi:hypothetical protein